MVEVFYEQLNFEMLTESEAYGVGFISLKNYHFQFFFQVIELLKR